jgi:hypothetical protein
VLSVICSVARTSQCPWQLSWLDTAEIEAEASLRYAGMGSYFQRRLWPSPRRRRSMFFANVISGPEDAGLERDCISSALV